MPLEDQKISQLTLSGVIRLLREFAILGVLSYLAIKLFSGELSLDFAKLSATELVNLLLAFFSIVLSAAFYFAATSQSNQFYDNVNKFTKETSELLGRVDEQVKGLGGRQSELKDSLDKYYFKGRGGDSDPAGEEAKVKVKEVEETRSKLFAELLEKTNLPLKEKDKFREELQSKDVELTELRSRIARNATARLGPIRHHTAGRIERYGLDRAMSEPIEEWAVPVLASGLGSFRRDLMEAGFTTELQPTLFEHITPAGRDMLLKALETAMGRHKQE
jgi:hypothetical protein